MVTPRRRERIREATEARSAREQAKSAARDEACLLAAKRKADRRALFKRVEEATEARS